MFLVSRVEETAGKTKNRIFLEPAKIVTVDTLEGLICTHEACTLMANTNSL